MASKGGAVGTNMSGALKGNTAGAISQNYKGKPRNANPQHPHNPANSQPVAEWTQNHMQQRREEEREKKQ
ncbi:unnamed protein product [Rotaria magnacalcarata]|uniref:Uncharacterized protein n=1 Tax=Rotaria magnacalcarata TaxID=392030 RepID=A0A8S3AY70_9BILA|nr:unnamed protein product [Rotaria magnacalcarata]CAF4765575.1 unnamed protein product [Rotaria magnacalcarata]